MSSINNFTATARIGKMELVPVNDTNKLKLSLAIDDSYKNSEGNYVDRTVWIDGEVWGNYGKALSDKLKVGNEVAFVGSLKSDSWEDDNGNQRKNYFLRIQSIYKTQGEASNKPKSDN